MKPLFHCFNRITEYFCKKKNNKNKRNVDYEESEGFINVKIKVTYFLSSPDVSGTAQEELHSPSHFSSPPANTFANNVLCPFVKDLLATMKRHFLQAKNE